MSEGCAACYAEAWAGRWGWGWGPTAERRTFEDAHWAEPLKWDRKARAAGRRASVFCGSMCDIAEEHPTTEAQVPRLWDLIRQTHSLDWLLLTKRAGRLANMILTIDAAGPFPFRERFTNVWALASAENQARLEERMAGLARLCGVARVIGLSCEPLLGPLDLSRWLYDGWCPRCESRCRVGRHPGCWGCGYPDVLRQIGWVICGGESDQGGRRGRPMDLAWAQSLRDQCAAAGVPFFMKQLGSQPVWKGKPYPVTDSHGADPDGWPPELCVRQRPVAPVVVD